MLYLNGVPDFHEGSPFSRVKWGPRVPILHGKIGTGSPKFYDTGVTGNLDARKFGSCVKIS